MTSKSRKLRGAAQLTVICALAALAFAVVAAVGVAMVLNSIQEPSSVAFTTTGARVGDPGNNLIGPS